MMTMSPEWLSRLQLGHCDGHIIMEPEDMMQTSTRELSAVRETSAEQVDRNRWAFRDAVVSFGTQKA